MAWTATGGDLMVIEALRMPGTGRLTVTGQLGDVMRESVDAAYSYVRSRAHTLGVEDIEFKEVDLHVHFPAGAIPKDGPSAGAAVTLAIASVLSRRPVRRDIALTGEMTLRGKVLEIGGVKEKVMAAYRAGLRQVILPKANEKGSARHSGRSREQHDVHLRLDDGRHHSPRAASKAAGHARLTPPSRTAMCRPRTRSAIRLRRRSIGRSRQRQSRSR